MADSKFWKELFVQHRIASNIVDIASAENGKDFQLNGYGTVNLTATKTSAIGENYMSDAYALKAILHDGQEYHSFIKVLPSNPVLREAAYVSKVYHREIGAYQDMVPKILALQKERGMNDADVPIAMPAVYYTHLEQAIKGISDGSGTTVVLEDLKRSGYRMADKKVGCDYEHARLTLQALANYHASSIAFVSKYREGNTLRKDFPSELAFLEEKTFFEDKTLEMVTGIVPLHLSILRASNLEDAADWIEHKVLPNLESIVKMYESFEDCGLLAGILHGDTWINNVMFRYEDDRVQAAVLVDWQIVRFGHPATDLLYYLFTSTTSEMRKVHMVQLLKGYYDTLSTALSMHGIDVVDQGYSFQKFQNEVEQRYVWGMMMAFMVLPMILDLKVADKLKEYDNGETTDLADTDTENLLAETEEKFRKLYTTQILLENELLCNRITGLVAEVYSTVCK